MEKLNELVELAKKATSGKWIADSGEGWDAIISQQDMVNGNFIVGEFIGPDSKANKDFVLAASPENILAIAKAFRALEQQRDALADDCGPSVQSADLKALMRFNETSDDGEGYDIGDQAMSRLVELGLVAKERGKMRIITSFGMWVIARENGEQTGVLETQRDRDLAFQQRLAQLRAGKDGE